MPRRFSRRREFIFCRGKRKRESPARGHPRRGCHSGRRDLANDTRSAVGVVRPTSFFSSLCIRRREDGCIMHAREKMRGEGEKERRSAANETATSRRPLSGSLLSLSFSLSASPLPFSHKHYNGPRDYHATRRSPSPSHSRFPRGRHAPAAPRVRFRLRRTLSSGLTLENLGTSEGKTPRRSRRRE